MKIYEYKLSRIPAIAFVVFLLAAAQAFPVTAVIEDVTGKVELKAPGGSWRKAREGMEVGLGTTVSTGFNSKAMIAIGESILEVKPLTRMDLEQLVEKEGTINTELHLKVGKIRADVRSSAGLKNNFRMRSPVSTAAVRGTVFEYDGFTLTVEQGTVVLSNKLGQIRAIGRGGRSSTDGYSLPASVEKIISSEFDVNFNLSDEDELVQFLEEEFGDYTIDDIDGIDDIEEYATIILDLYGMLGGVQ